MTSITIAFFDDDEGLRTSIVRMLELKLRDKDVRILDESPLATAADYPEWLVRNKVDVLFIDWRLDERPSPSGLPVNYQGGAIVDAVREKLPFFPVFVLTAYATSDDVRAHSSEVEVVQDRNQLFEDPMTVLERARRAAGRYSDGEQQKIRQLSELSQAAVTRELSDNERTRLRALQAEFSKAAEATIVLTDDRAFGEAEQALQRCEQLIGDFEKLARRSQSKRQAKK